MQVKVTNPDAKLDTRRKLSLCRNDLRDAALKGPLPSMPLLTEA
jgi:hypothetical protein